MGTDLDSLSTQEEEQPLFDENNMHYGSFDQQHMMYQEDPQETEREIAALQGVVERTSKYALSSLLPFSPFQHLARDPRSKSTESVKRMANLETVQQHGRHLRHGPA